MFRNTFGRAAMGGHAGAPQRPPPSSWPSSIIVASSDDAAGDGNDDNNAGDNRPDILRNPHGRLNEPEGGWFGYEVLGRGGFGTAAVWIKTDDTRRVIDRMVLKEVRPSAFADVRFDMIETWWIDRDTQKYSIPNEAAIGILLGPDPTMTGYHPSRIGQYDNNLVVAFGYSVDRGRSKYRIYMEYVGHDSLDDLIRYQRSPQSFGDQVATRAPAMPEPFCWYMLQRLARACRELAEPARIRRKYPEWPNAQVIHHDIKPGNIWFARPSSASFPLYPRPKLGDLGGARVTYDGDELNPIGWHPESTRGYMPPEMYDELDTAPHEEGIEFRTHATNTWQIGQTLRFMMQMSRGEQINYPNVDDAHWTPPMTNLAQNYSPELIDIVGRCVHQVADQRPTPIEILQVCGANWDKTEYMNDPNRASLHENQKYRLQLVDLRDKYRIGMRVRYTVVPRYDDEV